MSTTYFAADGSYGDATDITIVDTSDWTQTDWDHVEAASDHNLLDVVHMVMFTRKIANGERQ